MLLARLRQCCLCLAIRSGTLQGVLIPSCNSSTWSSNSKKRQKKQAAATASFSCKTSSADMAHAGMAPCRRLTKTDLVSCSLRRISSATIRPAAQSQLQGNDQGSSMTRRRNGEGQESGGVSCTDRANAAATAAAAASAEEAKRKTLLQSSTDCVVLLLQARGRSAPRF